MTRFKQLLVLMIIQLFSSCGERKTETIDIDQRAKEFITEIDSTKLNALQHLHFVYRGPNGFWQNDSVVASTYNLKFAHADNTSELVIHGPERFITDFSINLNYDTSIFNLKLIKANNKVRIYKNWDTLIKVVDSDSLTRKDPFKFISDLNDLKNQYKLIGITHYPAVGKFVEFYFTTEDVLTYLPDSTKIDPQFKSMWIEKWDTGQWIDKNWNLRRLDKPIEN